MDSFIYAFAYIKIFNSLLPMKTASKELKKLRTMAEDSLNKTPELQQVLAQIEASLARAEIQQVINKTNAN